MATDQTPITLSKILSKTWRIIASHPRQFSALSALFLLPISISSLLYYTFIVPQPSPKPQLLTSLIYLLSTLPFSLCAASSITYATFAAYHDKKSDELIIPSLRSILVSFFPLLATRFLTLVIIWLITFALGVVAMLAGLVAYMFGLDLGYDARNYFILGLVIMAITMPGLIHLEIKWCLSTAVVVLESKWGYAPLKRSSYLVHRTRKVAFELFLLFGLVGWGLSMWYFRVMASRGSKGWFCVEMVVYVVFATVLSLYGMVANTVFFINCKASRGEMEVAIDEEKGVEFVGLLKP